MELQQQQQPNADTSQNDNEVETLRQELAKLKVDFDKLKNENTTLDFKNKTYQEQIKQYSTAFQHMSTNGDQLDNKKVMEKSIKRIFK